MAEEKVYTQEVITDNPFPNGEATSSSDQTGTTSAVYTAQKIKDQPIIKKIIAQETIGKALNTKSKKILGDFQFTEQGAISIGKYTHGVSGDVKISPNGIVAKNSSGNTTFALDGDTGNATFSGTIQAGGDVTVIDEGGLVSLSNFATSNSVYNNLNQGITTSETNWTDITGASFSISLNRSSIVMILVKVTLWVTMDTATTVDALVGINIDGTVPGGDLRTHRIWFRNPGTVTGSMHRVEILSPGEHTIKLQGTVNRDSGSPSMNIYNYYFSHIVLGT